MSLSIRLLTGLLLAAGFARGADPPIKVPESVTAKPGRLARIVASCETRVKVVNLAEDSDLFREYDDTPGSWVYRFASSTAGRYKLGFYTASKDGVPSDPVYCVVIVEGPAPPPPTPVPPGPLPPPTPQPVAAPAWVIVVDDPATRTAQQGALLGDLQFWTSLEKQGIHWRILDKDNTEVSRCNLQPFVTEAGGLPALIVLAGDGRRLKTVKLPATSAEVLAQLKEAHR